MAALEAAGVSRSMAKKERGKKKHASPAPAAPPARVSVRDWLRRREVAILLGILLVAFGLRVGHLMESRANDPYFAFPSVDPLVYHEWAVEIADGNVVDDEPFYMGPLYAYFLGGVYSLFGVGFVVGRVAQIGLGLLTLFLAYRVGKRIYGVEVGLVSALLLAFYAPAIFYEGIFLIASLQAPLNLLVVLLLIRCHDRPTWSRWLVAGLLLGVSALARPNVLLLAGLVLPWIALGFKAALDRRGRVLGGLAFCAGVGLAVLPATLHNAIAGGDRVLVNSSGGVNFYIGNGPSADGVFQVPTIFNATAADNPEAQRKTFRAYAEKKVGRDLAPSEVSGFWYDETWDHIGSDVGSWLSLMGQKIGLLFNRRELPGSRDFESSREFSSILRLPLLGFGILGTLALVGLALGWRRDGSALPLYALVVAIVVSLALFFVLGRYRHAMAPALAVFAALAIVTIVRAFREKRLTAFWLGAAGILVAALFVARDIPQGRLAEFMVHYNLGNKYRQLERDGEAVERYRRSLALNPNYLWTHNNLARILQKQAETCEDALRVWRELEARAVQQGSPDFVHRARQGIAGVEAWFRERNLPVPR